MSLANVTLNLTHVILSIHHVILRACECFEFLLLLCGVLFGGKRPREISPSRVCVEVGNIAPDGWSHFG